MINANKVKVSKEVAAEIEYAKGEYRSIACATQYLLNEADLTDEQVELALRGYYGDYEVEQTPEEMVAEYYRNRKALYDNFGNDEDYGAIEGIEFVAKAYGLKIEGVSVQ